MPFLRNSKYTPVLMPVGEQGYFVRYDISNHMPDLEVRAGGRFFLLFW